MDGRVDWAVAFATQDVGLPFGLDGQADSLQLVVLEKMMLDVSDGLCGIEIGGSEQGPYVGSFHFAAVLVGIALNFTGEFDLQTARHNDPVFGFKQVGNAAFS